MIYQVRGHIICNNAGVRNAIKQRIPLASDNRVYDVGQGSYQNDEHPDYEDGYLMVFDISFEGVTDRNNVFAALRSTGGLLGSCEDFSWIETRTTYNYSENPQSDIITFKQTKVIGEIIGD
jgi:hypothetical protein